MIAGAMPSLAASPLASLFVALSVRFGGDAEPLAEDAIGRFVEQARAGDTGARQTLYVQYVDRVFRTVRGMLRSDADAEDVTQDAMLTVLTSLHRYAPRANARPTSSISSHSTRRGSVRSRAMNRLLRMPALALILYTVYKSKRLAYFLEAMADDQISARASSDSPRTCSGAM